MRKGKMGKKIVRTVKEGNSTIGFGFIRSLIGGINGDVKVNGETISDISNIPQKDQRTIHKELKRRGFKIK